MTGLILAVVSDGPQSVLAVIVGPCVTGFRKKAIEFSSIILPGAAY